MTPASPAETAELRIRAVNMIATGHVYEAVNELAMRACPKPSLHQVEGAPIQALADLLRTATELDEVLDIICRHPDRTVEEQRQVHAFRAAVRALNGSLASSRLASAHAAPATGGST